MHCVKEWHQLCNECRRFLLRMVIGKVLKLAIGSEEQHKNTSGCHPTKNYIHHRPTTLCTHTLSRIDSTHYPLKSPPVPEHHHYHSIYDLLSYHASICDQTNRSTRSYLPPPFSHRSTVAVAITSTWICMLIISNPTAVVLHRGLLLNYVNFEGYLVTFCSCLSTLILRLLLRGSKVKIFLKDTRSSMVKAP